MNFGMETELVEFKKSTGELKEGVISLASMLNKNGKGTLYFGVRNDGEILGQKIGDRTLREVSQGIANAIKPQVIPTIIMELCDDKNVIKVTLEGDEKPYSAYGKYYMRTADEDREISPQQLRSLMLGASDSIVNIESNNQELTFNQLKTLYIGNNLMFRENTFKQNLNLLTRGGTYNLRAGILADVNSYSIKVAVFRGTDKTNLIKRNEYGYKCMLVAVKQVLDYIEQTDHGVPLIVSRYGREVFDITENFITVTIPLNHRENVKDSLFNTVAKAIDSKDGKILEFMKENPHISVREISRLVGLGTTTITKRIHHLKEEIVERKGSKKTGQWIMK